MGAQYAGGEAVASVVSLPSCPWLDGRQEQAKVTEHEKGVHISRAAAVSVAPDELF